MIISTSSLLKKVALLFLAIAGLYYGRIFLIPIATGALLSTLFLPFCSWLELKRIPKFIAVTFSLFLLLAVIAGIATIISWQVSELTKDAELIRQKATDILAGIKEYIHLHWGFTASQQDELLHNNEVNTGRIISRLAGSVSMITYGATLSIVYFFLFLYYRTHIQSFITRLFPATKRHEVLDVINGAANVSQQYLVGLAKMILCLWIMYGIAFYLLGIKNFFIYAILCGVLEIIPYIGNITGTSITVLVTAAYGASPALLLGIIATYACVQFIQGWVLEPLIVGPQVRINPMATIIALVAGELIWGIPGVVLAIPLTAVLKIVCDHIDSLKPYGFLMGDLRTKKKSAPVRNA